MKSPSVLSIVTRAVCYPQTEVKLMQELKAYVSAKLGLLDF